jgi:hypothetical protein
MIFTKNFLANFIHFSNFFHLYLYIFHNAGRIIFDLSGTQLPYMYIVHIPIEIR